jgi:predicted MPP superfamily phosphohydrolase
LPSPARRTFLQQTASVACATPFVAGAYGVFYGRLNLETTHRRIRLARCPKAFEGFRIAQLSDIHIGPFMTSREVGRYVEIANGLKADVVTLTGDFVTWDPATQESVVEALAGLRAPFGVFGCLGNHEMWTGTQDSITRLFAARGIRILRQQRAAIAAHGDALNLIGVDFQARPGSRSRGKVIARAYLQGIEPLIQPDTVNILLSHNPNSFDRAAELGVDLSLAGHTHGGQVTLEFIHPSLTPSRLITSYVKGWFEKNGAQLYVNRGIGTIALPVRLGARPEITLFELTRG